MDLLSQLDNTLKKLKGQVANLLTLINLSFGALAIIYILQGMTRTGLLLILIAAIFDRLDGLVARKLKIESELGKQLDSMSDMVSFGIAPALLIYQAELSSLGMTGMLPVVVYMSCGALRLARFNISDTGSEFVGLPITAAGCILALLLLFSPLSSSAFAIVTLLLSLLMISVFRIKKI
ncbi:CDP-diacylglycerol--serine O-phosphatidyltransferase [Shouchella shacheensis]|uniref:CDP-diacylglycerol--serine O-phosphatidyltransferase n=1 Tax=Shouchella shacheensis TaxID=1649580 RepID=UPI000740191E|nr:CDP-diacylglycerol--serine O-phosphatidyltransferase [Shouchella shacheensis]